LGIKVEAYCHVCEELTEPLNGAKIIKPRIFSLSWSKILFVKERASAILLIAFLRLGERDVDSTTRDDSFLGNCLSEWALKRNISLKKS
jgi:hypothetical protein